MAKRQIRISGKELKEKLPGFYGQKINIVSRNGSVKFVYLYRLEADILHGRNMRLDKIKVPLDGIREVILEIAA